MRKCHDRTDLSSHSLVKKALGGVVKLARVAKCEGQGVRKDKLKPITKPQLELFVKQLDSAEYNGVLLAAMYILAFRAGLRCGELVYAARGKHTLTKEAVRVLTVGGREVLSLTFTTYKHSGTQDPFVLHIPATNDLTCPVAAVRSFARLRPNIPGTFFVSQVGTNITRNFFAKALQTSCKQAGYHERDYNTHSFRSGFVTHLAAVGVPMAKIKILGRWKSDAHEGYNRPTNYTIPT